MPGQHPGTQILDLCVKARKELLLVAPFIKYEALRRILQEVHDHVAIRCVTRWRPDEIAAGVSDIQVWDLFRENDNRTLYLCHNLHAKFYRADEHCLVGSANLTLTALGWSPAPNLELLITSGHTEHLEAFEDELLASLIEVDDVLYEQVSKLIIPIPGQINGPIEDIISTVSIDFRCWLPTLRTPEKLFTAYQGQYDELTTVARSASLDDLLAFNLPPGLDQEQFNRYIAATLIQLPLVRKVDSFVEQPRRFGEVKSLLKQLACNSEAQTFDAAAAWQTLMRWLLYFLPEHYELVVPRHTEIFARKR